ncbi:hypothetical protein ACHAPT_010278 [Fusarium lateritium]
MSSETTFSEASSSEDTSFEVTSSEAASTEATSTEATSTEVSSSEATSEVTSSETASSASSEITSSEEFSTSASTTEPGIPSTCGGPLKTVALAQPTPIYGNDIMYNDETAGVTLPFPIGIGDRTSDLVFFSPNGLITLFEARSDAENQAVPDNSLPDVAIFPFWDDLYFVTSAGHGVFYEVYPSTSGGREVTFEWVGFSYSSFGTFHFGATFYENAPSLVNYTYFSVPDQGASATVGSQKRKLGGGYESLLEWTFDSPGAVYDGFTLLINHAASFAYTPGTFDNTACGKRSPPLIP